MSDRSMPFVGYTHPASLMEGFIVSTFIGAAVVFSVVALGWLAWRKLRRPRRRR